MSGVELVTLKGGRTLHCVFSEVGMDAVGKTGPRYQLRAVSPA